MNKKSKKLYVFLTFSFVLFLLCALGLLIESFSLLAVITGNMLAVGTAVGLFYSTLHLQKNP